jgi:hypothetical protein
MSAQRDKPHFSVVNFREKHGHYPRGVAFWIFYFGHDVEPWIPLQKENLLRPLTYQEAKQYATAEAIRRSCRSVYVDAMPL